MKWVILLVCLMVPLMGAECSSPDGSHHEVRSVGVSPVPEPSGALLFGSALVLVGMYRRIRK